MRAYHSASSDDLSQRCERAWYYRYVEGLRRPDISWQEIEAGAEHHQAQRAPALGKACHSVLEGHYMGHAVDWTTFPARVVMNGLIHLPTINELLDARIERPIGMTPYTHPEFGAAATLSAGVEWFGFVDLAGRLTTAGQRRLGIDARATDGWVVFDYKTSSNPGRWAKTADALRADTQSNLYASDWHTRFPTVGASDVSLPMRWVYFGTKDKSSKPVDFTRNPGESARVVGEAAARAKSLDTRPQTPEAFPCNTSACGDFGGCEYHHTLGGPCSAQRRLGALIQARVPKPTVGDQNMGNPFLARAQSAKPAAAPAKPAAVKPKPYAVAPAAEPDGDEQADDGAEAEAPAPQPGPRGLPPWQQVRPPQGANGPPAAKPAARAPKAAAPAPAKPKAPKAPRQAAPPPEPEPEVEAAPVVDAAPGLKMGIVVFGSPEELTQILAAFQG